jgi:hypothetical protein
MRNQLSEKLFDCLTPGKNNKRTAMHDEMKRAFVSFHSRHDSNELMPFRNKEKGPCLSKRPTPESCLFFFSFSSFFGWIVTGLVEVVASQTGICNLKGHCSATKKLRTLSLIL